jgi:hypothetical protein
MLNKIHGRLYRIEDRAQAVAKQGGVTRRVIATTVSFTFLSVNSKIVKLVVVLQNYMYMYFILCM